MAGTPVREMLLFVDIENLRRCGALLEVHFDASHRLTTKALHFELDLQLSREEAQRLCRPDQAATFYKFGFGRNEYIQQLIRSTWRVRFNYEFFCFDQGIFRRMGHSVRAVVERNIALVLGGGVGVMVRNVL